MCRIVEYTLVSFNQFSHQTNIERDVQCTYTIYALCLYITGEFMQYSFVIIACRYSLRLIHVHWPKNIFTLFTRSQRVSLEPKIEKKGTVWVCFNNFWFFFVGKKMLEEKTDRKHWAADKESEVNNISLFVSFGYFQFEFFFTLIYALIHVHVQCNCIVIYGQLIWL